MNQQAEQTRRKLKAALEEYNKAKEELGRLERDCVHNWTKPVKEVEHIAGYTDPGDPPGTMGVDRRLPSYYPSRNIVRFRRTCSICGKEQVTDRTQTVNHPEEVPLF
jgi:hypothetical protein